jgi:UDP-glucose 4-epimerase
MKTLITGGAGFIGSHLSNYLLSQNQQVVILDDFSGVEVKIQSQLIEDSNLS